MNTKIFLLAFFMMLMAESAHAELDFLAGIGLHSGGDNVVTATFTDGSTEDLKAGEFLTLDFGAAWDLGILEARATAGWKYDTITATNGDLNFSRYTGQFLLLFAVDDWRFGGGTAYHFNIELEGSGVATSASAEYDDALGYVAEIDYYFNEKAYVGLQYTNIEYDRLATLGQTAATFDASSIGIVFMGRW